MGAFRAMFSLLSQLWNGSCGLFQRLFNMSSINPVTPLSAVEQTDYVGTHNPRGGSQAQNFGCPGTEAARALDSKIRTTGCTTTAVECLTWAALGRSDVKRQRSLGAALV